MSENVAPPRKRGALRAVPPSNVVALPKRPTGADAIVAEVLAKSQQQEEEISRRLRELVAITSANHRGRVNDLCPLGMAMTRPTLEKFIEIGQRLLAAGGGRS